MLQFFRPNIDRKGRMARGVFALLLAIGAGVAFWFQSWLGWVFLASAGFAVFEAMRGWCLMRACGIKTKM
jgi:hypothetical protein